MKKNIFSVIITALTVINVVLTAIMFFVMLPTFQKTNNLITKVATVLNLELESGSAANAEAEYTLKDLKTVDVPFESAETINLAKSADGKIHYALINGYSISVNSKAKDYKEVNAALTEQKAIVTDKIRAAIRSFTVDDISEEEAQKKATESIQAALNSKAVVGVTLTNFLYN